MMLSVALSMVTKPENNIIFQFEHVTRVLSLSNLQGQAFCQYDCVDDVGTSHFSVIAAPTITDPDYHGLHN